MSLTPKLRRSLAVWLLLAAVMAAASFHRVGRYKDRPLYDPRSDAGFFYTEEAFQYRYARMTAGGEAIPCFDKKAQWPEGVRPFRDLTLFQEYLHGTAFRLFSVFVKTVPLHVFLIYFVSFFSSLAVLALFSSARALGADRGTALLCSALYAFTGAAFARLQFYELENTAFPLMALSFAAFLRAIRGRGQAMTTAVISGGLMALALITWHFTRFYLLIFWAAMAAAFLLRGGNRKHLAAAAILLVSAALTGLLSPVMRSGGLIGSPTMLAAVLVVTGLHLNDRHGLNALSRLVLMLIGGFIILIVLSFGNETYAYGHVWDLLKYKLFHALVKPADSSQLPFAGRLLWNGPFDTPSPGYLIYRYGLLLPLALAALFRFVRQRRGTAGFADMLTVAMTVLFAAANIMVERLTIFGAFFLGLSVVYLFPPATVKAASAEAGVSPAGSGPGRFRLSHFFLAACLIIQAREAVLCDRAFLAEAVRRLFPDRSPVPLLPYTSDEMDMLAWIRDNTPEEAVFLSNQGNSPSILTYTGRAINLHPKLETEGLRKKYETALFALFGEDEEALYRLLDAMETDYYLYPANNLLYAGPDSERYMAGRSRISRENLTWRLHFDPGGFRRLRLVYRNRSYQIYRVLDAGAGAPAVNYVPPYFPVFDPDLFGARGSGPADGFDDALAHSVLERVDYAARMMAQAGSWLSRGNRRQTQALIQQALAMGLPDGRICFLAAEYMTQMENVDQAFFYIRQALTYDPENMAVKKLLARIYLLRDEPDRARSVLAEIIRQDPADAASHNDMGLILWRKKEFAAARDCFLRALSLNPEFEQARRHLEILNGNFQ
ncbi:MAG: tetratricopeptide repeat protein [Thermodesulfobacteriota bacterium]